MNGRKFINNIIEQVLELQLKLGFARESVSLYYPYASVKFLLDEPFENDGDGIKKHIFSDAISENEKHLLASTLKEVLDSAEADGMGKFNIKASDERVVLALSPDVVSYIHENYQPSEFLRDFIALFSQHHGITLEKILEVFERFSPDYVCEEMPEGSDFDYSIHFTDSSIDSFYYCIKDEFGHMIYHRFIESDYLALL